jgi:tRNA modification GTPase
MEETIAAIATPMGIGSVAVIRISGKSALQVADAVFRGRKGKPSEYSTHTMHYGVIHEGDPEPIVDEVLLCVMRAPFSYTTEDVVEISCHGGMVSAKRVLDAVLKKGARPAHPGEFTRRAFLNGRIDLTQAEAVLDVVSAQTEGAHVAAVAQLEGHLYRRLERVYHHLFDTLASVEAHIDFPEEDISPETREAITKNIRDAMGFQQNLLRTARDGKVLREGVRTIIVGKPNVGKSSLLNALLGQDRAIVHATPGTTRDVIEEVVSIEDLPIRLMDTAGLRDSCEDVEREGIERTRKNLQLAELVLLVVDGSQPLDREDRDLIRACKEKPYIIIQNKKDLGLVDDPFLRDLTTCSLSARTGEGMPVLKSTIASHLWQGKNRDSFREIFINARHQDSLQRSHKGLDQTLKALQENKSFEFVAADLRIALEALGEINGRNVSEDVLDRIFSKFCIGK